MKLRIPSWQGLTIIGRSKVITLTILVPVIGYMIIFNEQLISWFELSKLILPQGEVVENGVSEKSVSRLYYFYFGLSFLGIASAIYQLVCPNLIKQHQTDRVFVTHDIDLMTDKRTSATVNYLKSNILSIFAHELDDIEKRLELLEMEFNEKTLKEKRQTITDLMLILWQHENWSTPWGRAVVFILYLLGFGILAIPTVDTFLGVTGAFLGHI